MALPAHLQAYVDAIAASGLTIYDAIEIGDPHLWIPVTELQSILDHSLKGISVEGLALKTRSKLLSQEICKALGYPVPKSFTKTKPRFLGLDFDKYAQKANNLQIWNDEVSPTRRYVVIRISDGDTVSKVRVVSGSVLGYLDTTGKLTQKYQAKLDPGTAASELISSSDTENLSPLVSGTGATELARDTPIAIPNSERLLAVDEVYNRLRSLLGRRFPDPGSDQERIRGGELHRLACEALGYSGYADDGQFPDIRHQLTEVKLQTSPTIDLGLVTPDSESPLDMARMNGRRIRHCDVRYAMFHGQIVGGQVLLERLYVTTGQDFFGRFPKFGGRGLNKKMQISLPANFFSH